LLYTVGLQQREDRPMLAVPIVRCYIDLYSRCCRRYIGTSEGRRGGGI